ESTTVDGATTTAQVSGTADVGDGSSLEVRGQVGDYRLVILNFDESGFELDAPTSTSTAATGTQASGTEAAGEPLASAVTVADATVPVSELGTTQVQSSVEPAGEPIEILSDDSEKVVGGSDEASQVDAAMPDVTDSLTRISDTEDVVASGVTGQPQLLGEAVDEVLTGTSGSN
ncbi:MAG: peptidylprolyl isomerase, partial [Rhodopirellula bahusiensis]